MLENNFEALLKLAQNLEFTDLDKIVIGAQKKISKTDPFYRRDNFHDISYIPDIAINNPRKYFKPCFYCFKEDLQIIIKERGGASKHSERISNNRLIWDAFRRLCKRDQKKHKHTIEHTRLQMIKAKIRGYRYCYEGGFWSRREYRLNDNCQLIGTGNILSIIIPIEDQQDIVGLMHRKIDEVIDLGVYQTDNEEERKLIHNRFKLKEMEIDAYFYDQPLFELLLHEDEYHYETTTYLKVNKSSELYAYNVTAKQEGRDFNLPDDLYKIELRLKFLYFKYLYKAHPEVKLLNPVELFKWLKSRESKDFIFNQSPAPFVKNNYPKGLRCIQGYAAFLTANAP